MSVTTRIARMMVGGMVVVAACGVTMAAAPHDGRPNFIVLLTDDQRHDDLGCAGNPVIRTPNLDALAARGVRFRHTYASSSVCMASRATIFTGLAERRHACNFYYRSLRGDFWKNSYPVLLRAAGYRTGFIGKFGVTVHGFDKGLPVADFDWFHGYAGQGNYFPQGKPGPHQTRIEGDRAVEFIETSARGGQPFCLSISFFAPHDPVEDSDPAFDDEYLDTTLTPPPNVEFEEVAGLPPAYKDATWYARYHRLAHIATPAARQRYILQRYRLISGVDAAVGRVVETLRRLGLADTTVIVFTSDNGYYYGEHGLSTKFYMHDESIRVPLIVADPRLPDQRRGAHVDHLVSNRDLAPTLLDLAGVAIPASMQGRSLAPLMRGRSPPDWRDAVFCENIIKERRPMCDAIRTDRWKYISLFEQNPVQEELYDLLRDPHEQVNRAADPEYAGTVTDLRTRLQTLRVHYSGDPTGFPEWIQSQKEKESVWKGYRAQYEALMRRRASPGTSDDP